MGLALHPQKTKILRCNPELDKATIDFVELDDDFAKVLDDDESHRYLGILKIKSIFLLPTET